MTTTTSTYYDQNPIADDPAARVALCHKGLAAIAAVKDAGTMLWAPLRAVLPAEGPWGEEDYRTARQEANVVSITLVQKVRSAFVNHACGLEALVDGAWWTVESTNGSGDMFLTIWEFERRRGMDAFFEDVEEFRVPA